MKDETKDLRRDHYRTALGGYIGVNERALRRLIELNDKLVACQGGYRSGTVYLRLKKCGKGCGGCPHIEYRKLVSRDGSHGKFISSARLKQPTRVGAMRRNPKAYGLLIEALDLSAKREKAIETVRVLRRNTDALNGCLESRD